jgi:hypothetical protein
MKGRVIKFFPGGNTAYGFHSFYDNIIEADANRIYILKGGPGVGKSTFMRSIGEAVQALGYDIEFHCCSSDNGSLDGLVIPSIRVALLDGTSPHLVDPKNPGAVDEILNLGDFWDEGGIREKRDEILAVNKEISRLFKHAYTYLAAAKAFLDEVETFYTESGAFSPGAFDRMALELTREIFTGKSRQTDAPKARHLFATAITPDGLVSHLETIVGHLEKRYIIEGDDGTGKTVLVRRLMETALTRGYNVTAFHCALNPKEIEHLVINDLSLAIINSVEPHFYQPQAGDVVANTMDCVAPVTSAEYLAERDTARGLYRQCMEQAVAFIGRAKKQHDLLEQYYVPYMDFDGINQMRDKTLHSILALLENNKEK